MAVIARVAIVMMLVPAVMASLIALTFREAGCHDPVSSGGRVSVRSAATSREEGFVTAAS
jgi:hypothetical protein